MIRFVALSGGGIVDDNLKVNVTGFPYHCLLLPFHRF